MSYSFYYPYFSAREAYHDPLLDLQASASYRSQLRQELQERQMIVRRKQQQLYSHNQTGQYEKILQQKQIQAEKANISNRKSNIQGNVKLNNKNDDRFEQLRYSNHFQKMQDMQKEREFIDHSFQLKKDEKLRRQKDQNELKIQQYQQELLQKIASCRAQKRKKKVEHHIRSSNTSAFNQKQLKKNQKQREINVVSNKRSKSIDMRKKSNLLNHNTVENKLYQTLNLENYQTIDFDQLTKKKSQRTKASTKKKRRRYSLHHTHANKSHRHQQKHYIPIKYGESKRRSIQQSVMKSDLKDIQNGALQKIQNRLKLSQIIYKDSKWASTKHETSHLINTFELQERVRKEIKDSFNNHPQILKKHALVISSR